MKTLATYLKHYLGFIRQAALQFWGEGEEVEDGMSQVPSGAVSGFLGLRADLVEGHEAMLKAVACGLGLAVRICVGLEYDSGSDRYFNFCGKLATRISRGRVDAKLRGYCLIGELANIEPRTKGSLR
jgi:hypothetical protein